MCSPPDGGDWYPFKDDQPEVSQKRWKCPDGTQILAFRAPEGFTVLVSWHARFTAQELVVFLEERVKQACPLDGEWMVRDWECPDGSHIAAARSPAGTRERATFITTWSKNYKFATEEEFAAFLQDHPACEVVQAGRGPDSSLYGRLRRPR
jgi:hypothetical protein